VRDAIAVTALVARIDGWLFAPEPEARLRLLRAGIAAVLAARCATGPFARLGGQPEALFQPVWLLEWLERMPSRDVLVALQVVGAAAGLLALVRVRERLTFAVATGSLLVLEACSASRGKVQHNALPLLLVACVLVVAPTVRARRADPRPDARWGWPVRTSVVLVGGIYFLTGFQKVVSSGPAWVLSDNLRNVMYAAPLRGKAPTDSVSRAIAERAWLAHVVALATLVIELGGAAVIVWARARPAYVLAATSLHVGVWLTHGLDYSLWVATAAVVLIDWQEVVTRWRRSERGSGSIAPPRTPVVGTPAASSRRGR
jgi:hypothetical protein